MRETDTMTEQVVEDPKIEREDAAVSAVPGVEDIEARFVERKPCLRSCAIGSLVIFLVMLGTGLSEIIKLEQAGVITFFQAWDLAEFLVAFESASVLLTVYMGLLFLIALYAKFPSARRLHAGHDECEMQSGTSTQQDMTVSRSIPTEHEDGDDV